MRLFHSIFYSLIILLALVIMRKHDYRVPNLFFANAQLVSLINHNPRLL